MICRPHNRPYVGQDIDAMVCWFSDQSSLSVGDRYRIQHTTRSVLARVEHLDYRLDVNTLHRDETATSLSLNEIGRVRLRAQAPLMFDAYRRNRATGGFILVDTATNNTVAAGMILGRRTGQRHQRGLARQPGAAETSARLGACTVWLTGLSGSGKSTVAVEVEQQAGGRGPARLSARRGQPAPRAERRPGFSAEDRAENVRRVGEVARLFADAGMVAVVSLVSPVPGRPRSGAGPARTPPGWASWRCSSTPRWRSARPAIRKACTPRPGPARSPGSPGVDDPYEPPLEPELVLRPGHGSPSAMADWVISQLDG